MTCSSMKAFPALLLALFLMSGCATYYQRQMEFNRLFVNGEIREAETALDGSEPAENHRNRVLYDLNKGVVLHIQDRYADSSRFFENAYRYIENYSRNPAAEISALFSNPKVTPYKPDDFESVLIHYYKAVNAVFLNNYQDALVECRRINNKLKAMNASYDAHKNRYSADAFAWNLLGMIFEASGEINNAFVSYRNAYDAYRDVYAEHFGVDPPYQLREDLLRSAKNLGFHDERSFYERQFEMDAETISTGTREAVVLVNNGLGPVKDEWSINFYVVRGEGGAVVFENEELGLAFRFFLGGRGGSDDLGDLRFIRVAFPKYVERKPLYDGGYVVSGGKRYPLEIAEDINAIAFKTLEDRMVREMAKALLRLAVKQATEEIVRDADPKLGALLSIVNAISEQADTRNWQTLPYNIMYARVPIDSHEQRVDLVMTSRKGYPDLNREIDLSGEQSPLAFRVVHNIESAPLLSH